MTIAGGCRCCEEIERGKPINFEWNKNDRSDFIWFNSLKDKSPYMLNYLNVKGSQTSQREEVIVGTEGWRNCIFPMAIIFSSSSSSSFLFLLISLMSCDVMLCRPPKEFWEHTLQICNNHSDAHAPVTDHTADRGLQLLFTFPFWFHSTKISFPLLSSPLPYCTKLYSPPLHSTRITHLCVWHLLHPCADRLQSLQKEGIAASSWNSDIL